MDLAPAPTPGDAHPLRGSRRRPCAATAALLLTVADGWRVLERVYPGVAERRVPCAEMDPCLQDVAVPWGPR